MISHQEAEENSKGTDQMSKDDGHLHTTAHCNGSSGSSLVGNQIKGPCTLSATLRSCFGHSCRTLPRGDYHTAEPWRP